jgi:drug/metabolite transporter (DMT)-like permease
VSLKNLFLFILLGAFWGGSFVAIKWIVADVEPSFSAFLRMVVALLAVTVIFWVQKKLRPLPKELWAKVWGVGLLSLGIPFALLFWGQGLISAGLGGLLNASVPIWTTLLVIFLFPSDERSNLHPLTYVGIFLGFLGIFVLFWPILREAKWGALSGALAVTLGALMYAMGNIANRTLLNAHKRLGFSPFLFHQHLAAVLFLGLLSFATEDWTTMDFSAFLKPDILGGIVYLGVFSTAVALVIYFHLLKEIGSVRTGSVTYLVPMFALLWDYLIFRNRPEWIQIFGMGIILMSIFFLRSRSPSSPHPAEAQSNQGNT